MPSRWALPAALALVAVGVGAYFVLRPAPKPPEPPPPGALLKDIGPRIVSNQTSFPVFVYGERLEEGMRLVLVGGKRVELPTDRVNDTLLIARIPEDLLPIDPATDALHVAVSLLGADGAPVDGEARLLVVNDTDFVVPFDLAVTGKGDKVYVSSPTQDELFVLTRKTGAFERLSTADGPRSIQIVEHGGRELLLVTHEYEGSLWAIPTSGDQGAPIEIPVEPRTQGLAVDPGKGVAYLSNTKLDEILVVDLGSKEISGKLPAGENPGPVSVIDDQHLFVVNTSSHDISVVDTKSHSQKKVRVGPGATIIGGHTERFSKYVMNLRAPRAVAYSAKLGVGFFGGTGPNIGPNPDRMEVSMNGGVSVVDKQGRFIRHVSILRGVPEHLVLDEKRNRLYVADIATGRIVALDAKKLARSDSAARKAELFSFEVLPPEGTRFVRAKEDFEKSERSSVAIHSGPSRLALTDGGRTLLCLLRFSGEIVELDVSTSSIKLVRRHRLPGFPAAQTVRKRGEILYFTDLGNTRMTCDTCHRAGHDGGLLFTKGRPIRIYRSPTFRAARESPPFFTPAKLPSLIRTVRQVMARNRYQNPVPTKAEVTAAARYSELIPTPPNPYLVDGATFSEPISLPDGESGTPSAGHALFFGKAGCAAGKCHPPPHFTGDQDKATRASFHDVGTPQVLDLRKDMQDVDPPHLLFPPPALVGVWDTFPLLMSGAAGFEVKDDAVRASDGFALRWVLDHAGEKPHGNAAALSPKEKNDLLAYLLTL